MKINCRNIILLFTFSLLAVRLVAQDPVIPEDPKTTAYDYNALDIGLRIMPTFSSFAIKTYSGQTVSGEPSRGYGYMLVLDYNFTRHIGIETGLAYNSFSKRYKDFNLDREVNIKYMNVPLLLSLSTNKAYPVNFNIVAGPQIGFDAGSNARIMGEDQTDTLNGVFAMKRSDLELVYGAGLDFSFSKAQELHVGIGFRAAYGLSGMNNNEKAIQEDGYYILDDNKRRSYSGYVVMTYGF